MATEKEICVFMMYHVILNQDETTEHLMQWTHNYREDGTVDSVEHNLL